ncbi:MAG: PIN domain-containing protein [Chlorobi bacterium CHB2]|nr:PIN domain-containing protein [Chlorobi bacterium CHB2]
MANKVIIDTGVLVALLDKSDEHHIWAVSTVKYLQGQFLSCEAVLAEACYLLRHYPRQQQQVLGYIMNGTIALSLRAGQEMGRISVLMERYAGRMDFADACIVRMAELEEEARVLTVDSDFLFYRKNGRSLIPLIAPFA